MIFLESVGPPPPTGSVDAASCACDGCYTRAVQRGSPDPERLAADLALVRSARTGDARARRALGERLRCAPRILGALNARRGGQFSQHELDDMAQEVVIRVLSKLEDYHGLGTFEAWVFRFAFHVLMNAARSHGRDNARFSNAPAPEELPAAAAPDTGDEYEEVDGALATLDPAEAQVVRLKHYSELSFPEIGAALGISPNTAKTRYYRALRVLERRLGREVQEERR